MVNLRADNSAGKTAAPAQSHSSRRWSILIKSAVTTALLLYLVRSGALDLSALTLLATEPALAVSTALNWILVSAVLGAWRYRTLLLTLNIRITAARAIHLQLASLFLNTVVPGSIGGDIWKSLAVAKHHDERKQTLLFMLLVERGIGLSALMATSCLLWLIARLSNFAVESVNGPLTLLFGALSVGLIGIPVAAAMALEWEAGWRHLESISAGRSWFKAVVAGAKSLRGQRKHLIRAYLISMAMHFLCIVYFFLLCKIFPGASLDLGAVATVFPIGILSVMLPVSLAGLGVGHLAFESLFASMGASEGANVFNLYIFGQVAPNLLGAIPFVVARHSVRPGQSS